MEASGIGVLVAVLVAAIGVVGTWITARVGKRGDREHRLIDQMQEELDRMQHRIEALEKQFEASRVREHLLEVYVIRLEMALDAAKAPPVKKPENLVI